MPFLRAIPGNKEVTLLTGRAEWALWIGGVRLGIARLWVPQVSLCPATVSGHPGQTDALNKDRTGDVRLSYSPTSTSPCRTFCSFFYFSLTKQFFLLSWAEFSRILSSTSPFQLNYSWCYCQRKGFPAKEDSGGRFWVCTSWELNCCRRGSLLC